MPTLQQLLAPVSGEGNPYKYVPFTAFLRIEPINGKRAERTRDMQKIAADVESSLTNFCDSTDEAILAFSSPIAFTPAFGNKPARLTITGTACPRREFTKLPVGQQTVDDDGVENTGYGCGNAVNRIPDPNLIEIARTLKNGFEDITVSNIGLQVLRIEVAGFIFGVGGYSLPS